MRITLANHVGYEVLEEGAPKIGCSALDVAELFEDGRDLLERILRHVGVLEDIRQLAQRLGHFKAKEVGRRGGDDAALSGERESLGGEAVCDKELPLSIVIV